MEGNEAADNAGFRWIKYGFQLTAFDPYFYADDLRVAEWAFNQGKAFLRKAEAFFPLPLSRGSMADQDIPVVNPGEVEACPVWEIRGPVRGLRVTSPDGQSFGIAAPANGSDTVAEGWVLTVDTRPGHNQAVIPPTSGEDFVLQPIDGPGAFKLTLQLSLTSLASSEEY